MDTSLLENILFLSVLHGASAFLLFAGALSLSSATRLNKGAKSNMPVGLIAVGLTLLGLAEGNQLLEHLGLAIPAGWDHIKVVAGSLFLFLGAFGYLRIIKKVSK